MIKKLKLEYFMRHESLEVEFGAGLQCIRGWNESGKSSVINAIAYALFGTKALRTSLEDTVTWGKDAKSLKVELDVVLDNKAHTFKRSKGGAEVVHDGKVFVTGQTEVTKFAESMLGADMNVANKLMFSSQNGIRGALEEGPKALSTLIEELGGFSTFDQILEAAQHKLALGSPALIEERLKGARSTLEAATANLPAKPEPIDNKVKELRKKISTERKLIPDLQARAAEICDRHAKVAAEYLKGREIETKIEAAKGASEKLVAQIEKTAKSVVEVDVAKISDLREQVREAESYEARIAAWRKFSSLPKERFEGTAAEFEKKLSDLAAEKKVVTAQQREINDKMVELKHKRINNDTCDKCGQDITHLEHVKTTNAEVDAMTAQLVPQMLELEQRFLAITAEEEALVKFRRIEIPVKQMGAFVEYDESTFPVTVTWLGDPPPETVPVAPRAELAQLEATQVASAKAQAQLDMLNEQLASTQSNVDNLSLELKEGNFPNADAVLELAAEEKEAQLEVTVAEGNIILAENEIAQLKQVFDSATQLWDAHAARIADAEKVIAQCEADLDSLSFNNALVAKLRKIRPLVANKVWNTVLSGVSAMFSQIRGLPSVITKEKDGFKCDGQAVESLSGSTLDALGLALRVALIRTFVPHCGLLVLDEVTAACDADRTMSMLGFIKTVDMGQTLLITHEEVSETFADKVIEL